MGTTTPLGQNRVNPFHPFQVKQLLVHLADENREAAARGGLRAALLLFYASRTCASRTCACFVMSKLVAYVPALRAVLLLVTLKPLLERE